MYSVHTRVSWFATNARGAACIFDYRGSSSNVESLITILISRPTNGKYKSEVVSRLSPFGKIHDTAEKSAITEKREREKKERGEREGKEGRSRRDYGSERDAPQSCVHQNLVCRNDCKLIAHEVKGKLSVKEY